MTNQPEVKSMAAQALLSQLTFARATELARAGHYREAETVLSACGGGEAASDAQALDLLARMRAQEGRLAEAEKLWTRARQLAPDNAAYHDALRRIASTQRRSARRQIALPLAFCLGVVASLIGAILWLNRPAPPRQDELARAITTDASPQPAEPSIESKAIPTPDSGSHPDIKINATGLKLENASNALRVTFDEGLFAQGVVLKPGARQKLAEVGLQLKPYTDEITVEIVGVTDDLLTPLDSRYKDNAALGMERARVVYDHLRAEAGLGARMFKIGSDGERQAPYPNDTPGDRARNRTVVLRITAR